jgi:Asp-tRNA(Asn)/Glu-tRNA(Gln) amidotransferase A subunit family amidase
MRRPAAVSGVYGQRPSQGAISLERVLPLGGATDTAGVFSRDPYKASDPVLEYIEDADSPSVDQIL